MMMSVYTYSGWVCGRERPLLQIGSIIKFSLDILKFCRWSLHIGCLNKTDFKFNLILYLLLL